MKFTENIKKDLLIVVILLLLSSIFFWKIFLHPKEMIFAKYWSDIVSFVAPNKFFIQKSFEMFGQLPLWNPYIFMGHPYVGNPLISMFYPTNFLFLISYSDSIFGFLFLLDIFLVGVFTYFFTQMLKLDKFSSILSSIVYMFSGIMIGRVYAGHTPNLDVIILTPLLFLLAELAIKKKSLFYAVLASIPLGLQFLAGMMEFVLYSSFGLFIYFLLRLIFIVRNEKSLKSLTKLIPIIILPFIIGLLLSAIQLLPTLELSKFFHRSEWKTYEFSTQYSFPPQQLMTFIIPEFFGTPLDDTYWGGRNFWELSVYAGILPLILAFIAILYKKNDHKIIFTIMFVLFLLLAFGKYFPIHRILFYIFPLFKLFRMPAVALFISIFSLSILSGFGSNFLIENIRSKQLKHKFHRLFKILSVIIILTFLTVLLVYILKNPIISFGENLLVKKYEEFTTTVHSLRYGIDYYMAKIPEAYSYILRGLIVFLTFLTISTFALIIGLKRKIDIRYFKILILLIILSDLWFFGMKYIDVKDPKEIYSERIPMEIFKEDKTLFRVVDFTDSLPQHIAMTNQIEGLQSHDAIQIKYYRNFIVFFFYHENITYSGSEGFVPMNYSKTISKPNILGLLNVKYILTETPIENDKFILRVNLTSSVYNIYLPTSETKTVYVYENKEVLPRAFVIPNSKVIRDEGNILQEMDGITFNPKEYVILEKDINAPLVNIGEYKEAEIIYYSPNEIHLKTNLQNPGFLVLSENWYPGWKAYDNGVEKEIYKTDYILRSIYLEKGEHEIKFVYKPFSFRLGFWITIITFFSICVFIIYKIRQGVIKN